MDREEGEGDWAEGMDWKEGEGYGDGGGTSSGVALLLAHSSYLSIPEVVKEVCCSGARSVCCSDGARHCAALR